MKKIILTGLIAIMAFAGFRYLNVKKQASLKREAVATQRKVMVEYWKNKGLSDEKIQLRLENLRSEKIDSGTHSPREGIMRVLGTRDSLGK